MRIERNSLNNAFFMYLVAIIAMVMSSCGSGGSSGGSNPENTSIIPLLNKTYYWDSVTLYTNNDVIPLASQRVEYEVFVNNNGIFNENDIVASIPAGQNSWLLNLIPNPLPNIKYYVWVKAVDYNSIPPVKSDVSARVEFYFYH